MRYRGFIITSTPDSGIERYDRQSSQDVLCNGYYCQIYDGDDDQYANQLDDFCIAEGHEIKDCSYGELERGIARYVDDHYDDLVEEQQYYSSKYAMTELLVCGECKTPYRRCTWTVKGQKKIVWRCINRLDFGKKYCHNSPTVEESILQRAVMRAIMETAQQNLGVLQTLKVHIGMGLQSEQTEDNSMELQIRIAEIDAEFKAMLAKISTDTVDAFDEEKAKRLMDEKAHLQQQLGNIRDGQLKREQTQSRLDDIYTILDGLKNRPMEYDEQIVRQLLECITVDSKEQITVIFVGGLKVVQPLID